MMNFSRKRCPLGLLAWASVFILIILNVLHNGNILRITIEDHKRIAGNAFKSSINDTDFGIKAAKSLKVMLYVTTHMSSQHIWYLKSCWIPALQNSLLLRSSDVVVHLNPSNNTVREEGKKLLKATFQNQTITIHDRSNPGYQSGAISALEDAAKEGWFKGYDWVIRVNPDVIIRNDTYMLDIMQNDPNATAILINCANLNPQNPQVHTDFFAIKPGALAPNTFINSTIGNAEYSFTNDIGADILNKGNHRWIKNSEPKRGICRAGYYRKEDERDVTHSHVGEDKLLTNFTCPIPF